MKKIFTSLFALMCLFAVSQMAIAGLTYTVVVPTPTYEVYIAGSFATDAWAPSARKLTKVDDTHYTITIDNATEDVKYKYCSGPDWAYVMKDKDGNEISDLVWDNKQDTVAKWAAVYNPNVAPIVADIVVEAYVAKAVTELYITGSHIGWKSPGSEGTKMNFISAESDNDGNFFRDTIHTDNAASLKYKFASGPSWSYEQKEGDWTLSDPNLTAVLHDSLSFKRIYPGAAGLKTVTITATAPAGTQHMYIMGSHLGWDGQSWAGTRIADGKFVFTVPNIDFMEYKYWYARDWGTEEKQADGVSGLAANRVIDAQLTTTATDVVAAWGADFSAHVDPVLTVSMDNLTGLTVVGTPTTTAGKVGNAYQGATDSYVKIPTAGILNTQMSISFWYKVNATPNRAGIIGMGNYDSIPGGTLWNNHFVQGIHLFREDVAGKQRLKTAIGIGKDACWNDGVDIASNADWVHVSIVTGKGESKTYVNGLLASNGNVAAVGASPMNAMDTTNCRFIEIGKSVNFESQGWDHHADLSLIDEVKIYTTALTDLQVAHNYWVATGVNNPTVANNLVASFYNGELRIENYTGAVRLFDLTGKMLLNNYTDNGVMQLDLNKGIYILNTTEGNMKLIVK